MKPFQVLETVMRPLVFFRQEADVRAVELCQRRTEGCPLLWSSLPLLLRLFMNLEVRVQGSSLRPLFRGGALNLEFRVQGPGFGIQSSRLRVQGFVRVDDSRLRGKPEKTFFQAFWLKSGYIRLLIKFDGYSASGDRAIWIDALGGGTLNSTVGSCRSTFLFGYGTEAYVMLRQLRHCLALWARIQKILEALFPIGFARCSFQDAERTRKNLRRFHSLPIVLRSFHSRETVFVRPPVEPFPPPCIRLESLCELAFCGTLSKLGVRLGTLLVTRILYKGPKCTELPSQFHPDP